MPGTTRVFAARPVVVLFLAFAVSRAVVRIVGVAIDPRSDYQWQLLDPSILRERFLESLVYLHAQPPFFNALRGAMLKCFPGQGEPPWAWWFLQMGIGLGIEFALFGTLRRLGTPQRAALVIAVASACGAPSLLYENCLSYTYLDAALLIGAAYLLVHHFDTQSRLSLWAFFGLLTILCATRSLYHFLWLLLIAAWVLRRTLLVTRSWMALPPIVLSLVIVGSIYCKNLVMFGFLGSSSWTGMNLATMTHTQLDKAARLQLLALGAVSDLTLRAPFEDLADYGEQWGRPAATGVVALDAPKRFDSSPNFNHIDYIAISRQFSRDALAVIRSSPVVYLQSVARNMLNFFFRASTDYHMLEGNRGRIKRWDQICAFLFYGEIGVFWHSDSDDGHPLKHLGLREVVTKKISDTCFFVPLITLLVPVCALRKALKSNSTKVRAMVGFAIFTLVYVMITADLMNLGETHRMRFELEPLLFALAGLALADTPILRRIFREPTHTHLPVGCCGDNEPAPTPGR
ncbi:MAG: hypothetical protein ABSB49_13815 [Polyangia bacterium]|jgi:hypothetical protein